MTNPWKVSAQFAAFVWFTKQEKTAPAQPGDAARFARDNWVAFLPLADEGMGQLLIKVARTRRRVGTAPRKRSTTTARVRGEMPVATLGRS